MIADGTGTDGRIVPKLKQRKDGNWTCKVDKKPINLQTKTYSVARERALEATYEGKRDWSTERFYDTTAAPASAPAMGAPANDWQSDVADAVASGLKPDAYFNPAGEGVRLLPAGESAVPPPKDAPPTADEPPKVSEDGTTQIPPEMFERMMGQLGEMIVEAQIKGQEWLIARALKANAGPVPLNNVGRVEAAKFWNQQLALWMPSNVPLPPWAVAMVTTAMFTIPVQLSGATPIKVEPEGPPNVAYPTG